MKKACKALCLALVLMLTVMSLAACETFDAFYETFIHTSEEDFSTVKIGVFEPLKGHDKSGGQLEKEGIEIAHELFPEVLGKPVELIYADNKSDIYAADTAIQELIQKSPVVILGSYGNIYSMVAGSYVEDAKIPAISVTNSNPLVTIGNPYYFRVCVVDAYEGTALAKFVYEYMQINRVAILRPSGNDAAVNLSDAFEAKFEALTESNTAVVTTLEYNFDVSDFESIAARLKEVGVTAIFLPDKADDAARVIRIMRENGVNATFIGTDDWADETFIESLGPYADRIAYSTMYDENITASENASKFLEAYHAKHGEDVTPEPAVALGFDAYMLAIKAISECGTVQDPELLRQNIAQTAAYPGASGNITLGINGDPMKTVAVLGIMNGEIVNLYRMEPSLEAVKM